jgi:hypothetical protein
MLDAHVGSEIRYGLWRRHNPDVSVIRHPTVLDPAYYAFPAILGSAANLRMQVQELVEELDWLLALGPPKGGADCYVYGLQVLKPVRYTFSGDPGAYGDVFVSHSSQAELRVGHIGWELLYRCEADARPRLLRDVLASAEMVRLDLQRPKGRGGGGGQSPHRM